MQMNQLLSKIRRLRAMSNHEISYRLREACHKEVDRLKFRLRLGAHDPEFDRILDTYRGSLKPYLQCIASRRYYPSLLSENRQAMIELLEQMVPDATDRAVEYAERLCTHRLNLLGYPNTGLGEEINWHRDPVSGHLWPKRFWA